MSEVGLILAAIGLCGALLARQHELLHLLQLEHYESARLRVWVGRRGLRLRPRPLAITAAAGALLVAAALLDAVMLEVGVALAAGGVVAARRAFAREQLKPLVVTVRARRLLVLAVAPPAALAVAAALLLDPVAAAATLAALALLGELLGPEQLMLANSLLKPVQSFDNRRWARRARRRLEEVSPTVVGITGSYGKTTTKGCVAAVADLRGPAYPTPASFNSYLGVVRAINEGLRPIHRTFVCEMGAYRRGDVRELCRLVEPEIGILTAIGPAHLERFGTLEETALAKGELAEELPAHGLFVTRADDERCRGVALRAPCPVRLFAPAPHPDADVWAERIRIEEGRSLFDLVVREDGGEQRAEVRARLLGEHNVANLLAAAAIGSHLGLPLDAVARALSGVVPPDHRLQPIVNRAAGIVVIDDAYNANPEGARSALRVLAEHRADRRLLVTPGMVELGSREAEENEVFGRRAAEVCDLVVLVGERQTEPIRAGLAGAGFPDGDVRVVSDMRAAQRLLEQITRAGDVILFENDLPDLYASTGDGAR